jgi:hypothetical protein
VDGTGLNITIIEKDFSGRVVDIRRRQELDVAKGFVVSWGELINLNWSYLTE